MMVVPAGVKVHLALGHTDMRKGLDGLATLIQEHLKKDPFVPGRSTIAEAIRYALSHWNALTRFLHDGRIELDTNPVERAIRPEPARYLPLATYHSLRNILDRLLVVVQASAKKLQDTFGSDIARNQGYRNALIELSTLQTRRLRPIRCNRRWEAALQVAFAPSMGSTFWKTAKFGHRIVGTQPGLGLPTRPSTLRLLPNSATP